MPRPLPNISLAVRFTHGLVIVLLSGLTLTGLRLSWFTGQEWLDAASREIIDQVAPAGKVYQWHTILGTIFVAAGIFYLFYLLISGEGRRLTNLFHRHEYSFLKKIAYIGVILLGAVSAVTGTTMYAGLYQGGPGFLFNSFLHQWSFRLLWLFVLLHVLETIISRGRKINVAFFGPRFAGFYQWPALLIAAAVATAGGIALHRMTGYPQILTVPEGSRAATIDGYDFPEEWEGADSIVVQTQGGANLTYGAAEVTVKAFRTRQQIHFLLRWADNTRSVNRHLVKTDSGWVPVQSEYLGPFGEDIHYEDQAALYFDRRDGCLATCHIGAGGRMGRHNTERGDTADVWVWRAVSTNPTAEADDQYWIDEVDSVHGGRRLDNKASGGYRDNIDSLMRFPYFVPTHRIFRDWLLYGAPGYEAYDAQADTFSVGSRIPAILVAPTTGDRGDIEARGVWREGVWTLEMRRALSTGSNADLRQAGELYLGVAIFDNAERRHAYHLRPIRLLVE